jgi:hypothetical protein
MRWLIGLVLVLGGLWSGYWFIGARGFEREAEAIIAQIEASGRAAAHQGLTVQGFPNRFDLTVTQPQLAHPATGISWKAPFLQILSLSYKPWHLIAAFAPEQQLKLRGTALTLRAAKLQASIVAQPVTARPLDQLTLAGDALVLEGAGWQIGANGLRAATRRGLAQNTYDIAATLTDLAPDAGLMAKLGGALPPKIDLLRLEATTTLTAPIDHFALQTKPQIAAIDLTEARLDWGPLQISATGRVIADAAGFAEGRVTLRVENWQAALKAAQNMGGISTRDRQMWEQGITLLARGSDGTVELPLQFQAGLALLGPIPIGPAPRLR